MTTTVLPDLVSGSRAERGRARSASCEPRAGLLVALLAVLAPCGCARPSVPEAPPARLADTGLYADFAARTLAPGVLTFTPQYPLWTDGAAKERWIALPPGTTIDASDPDHWEFPVGTRLWKEFRFGRPIETRFMMRRADGTWAYATYQWREDGSDAVRAPDAGVRNACPTGDTTGHDLPAVGDCRLCHEGTRTPVLGFSALQLSPARDPLAPHADAPEPGDVDLDELVARGLVRGLPPEWRTDPPRIAARSARERAALGYLHANCGNCHNAVGPLARLGLRLDYPLAGDGLSPALATALDAPSGFVRPGLTQRIAPGRPDRSTLVHRLGATDPLARMPPFGRYLVDDEALALLGEWIAVDLAGAPLSHALAK
ncbi:MAG TPA: hypothetical protein VK081_07970 [Planctomycetota bacterium]|nr:hypothetical protein [Planctomycetota bacterium]